MSDYTGNEVTYLRAELTKLRAEIERLRSLLREAVARLDYPELANTWGGWVIAAKAAGGGE